MGSFGIRTHFHEAEPTALARLTVRNDLGVPNFTEVGENLSNHFFRRIPREIPDINPASHVSVMTFPVTCLVSLPYTPVYVVGKRNRQLIF
jgi:hypothetical protein